MSTPHPLDILFLTNFSDFCFRTIPSLAQMADSFSVRLTLMHVYDPERTTRAKAMGMLESFFPEADRYRSCQRIATAGPVVEAVQKHLDVWPVNLIVAPASDPIGVPRIGDCSLRARVIQECGVPVWTMGRRVQLPKLLQPVKNVACWLDFHGHGHQHLPFAMEYAHRLNANLHLLHALPPIHEGSLMPAAHQNKPLHPAGAAEYIARMSAASPVRPQIHIAPGEGKSALCQMLAECDADLVFLRHDESFLARWLGLGLRLGDAVPCPAIYVGEKLSVPVWNLEQGPGTRTPVRVAEPRSRSAVAGARNGGYLSGMADLGLV